MKKLLITTVIVSTAFALVSAQNSQREPERKMIRAVSARIASTSPEERPEGMPKPEIPRTGDSIIDGKIVSLVKEREEKIKAIREEYQAKIKTIIGDKKVLMKEIMASGTRPMMRDDDRQMNASGTPGNPRRPELRNVREERSKPIGFFNGLFRSFFGGDAQNAQAQEVENQ